MNNRLRELADIYTRIGRRLADYGIIKDALNGKHAPLRTLAVEYHYISMIIRFSDDINQTIAELKYKDIPCWQHIYEKRNRTRHIVARTLERLATDDRA